MPPPLRRPVLIIVITLSVVSLVRAAEVVVGPARVIDGDTIEISGTRIRLEGIDAPETKQTCNNAQHRTWACGKRSGELLSRLTNERDVKCEGSARDDYGRLLGTCFVAGQNINAEMIRQGLAWAFVKYSSTYVSVEQEARRAKRGVFAIANLTPWEFRAEQRKRSEGTETAEPAGSCAIKGNINGKGAHIYHVVGQRDYKRVKINEKDGERWFCTESEAERAGWRKATR